MFMTAASGRLVERGTLKLCYGTGSAATAISEIEQRFALFAFDGGKCAKITRQRCQLLEQGRG
jgi:hypothetical protein